MQNNFWRAKPFFREWSSNDKNEYNFSIGNGVPNTALKFFSQKTPYRLNESQKNSLGAHFLPYQWFYRTDCLPKN